MATGDQYVAIQTKRLLGFQDLRERFLNYLLQRMADVQSLAFGDDGVFGGTAITLSIHSGTRFQLDNDQIGTDNDGHFLMTDAELAGRDVGLAFENTPTVVYDVALHYAERPRGVQVNPRTGAPEFVAWEETVGERAEPDTVVDNGNGTITLTADSTLNPFDATFNDGAGRQCLVWKKTPGKTALTEAAAVEQLVVANVSGANKITTSGTFGQTTVSTTATDYYVLLLGPTVIRNSIKDLEVTPAYEFIGQVTGDATTPTFDTSQQNDLGAGYAIALNAITRLDAHGDLKLRVSADASDVNEPQLQVVDVASAVKFEVDEQGYVSIPGAIVGLGLDLLSTALAASAPAISGRYANLAGAVRSLLTEWKPTPAGLGGFRTYALTDGAYGTARLGLAQALNAEWDENATAWTVEATSKPSLLLRANVDSSGAGKTSELVLEKVDPTATFGDAAWKQLLKLALPVDTLGGGGADDLTAAAWNLLLEITNTSITGSNPAAGTGYQNTLCAKSICKAWATITTDGVGGYTLHDGFSISTVAIVATQYVEITVGGDFANTNWGATAIYWSNSGTPFTGLITVEVVTVKLCRLRFYNAAGALQDPDAVALGFFFEAKGQQDT